MKKIAVILLALILSASLFSCNKNEVENPEENVSYNDIDALVADFMKDYKPDEKKTSDKDDTTPISELFEVPYQEDLSAYIGISRDNYFGIKLEKPEKISVTQKDMVDAINKDLEDNGLYFPVTERGAKLGDAINLNFKGSVDGVAFDGGTAENYEIVLGEANFIDGFEDALVGHKTGEEFTIDVTFPENYGKDDLNGKAAKFDIKINSIAEKQAKEFNDDFIKQTLKFDSVDDYLVSLYNRLDSSLNEEAESELKNNAYTAIFDSITIRELPKEKYDYYYQKFIDTYTNMAKEYNMDLEAFTTTYLRVSMEDFYKYADESATSIVEQELVAFSIANAEKLWQGLTKQDYDNYLVELAEMYGMEVEAFEEANGSEDIWKSLILDTVIDFVIDNSIE